MVNKYLLLFIALCSLHTYAQDSRFRINGTVDTKYDNALVTLFTFTGNVIRSVDSCYVKDGHFGFQGTEYLYEKSIISLGNYPDTVLYAELMLGRGDIFVKLAPKSVVQSPLVDEYKAWKDSCSVYWRRFFKAEKEKKDEMYNQYWACRYAFEKKHIHNALGRNLFLDELNNTIPDCPYFIQMCDSLYEMLSERDKSRGDVKEQYKRWGKKKRQLQMIGKRFVDFAFVELWAMKENCQSMWVLMICCFLTFGHRGAALVVLRNRILSNCLRNTKEKVLKSWVFHWMSTAFPGFPFCGKRRIIGQICV